MSNTHTYEHITARIIEMLEDGVVPWRKPWRVEVPRNLSSGKPYRGLNALMLAAAPYGNPWWLTFKQARERGGNVRKGEKGWPIHFWKFVEKKDRDTGEVAETYAMLKRWTVFNVEQCESLAYPHPVERDLNDIAAAALIVERMPARPIIHHDGGNAAFYRPSRDTVHMPAKERFESMPEYYSVLFHELAHSTGHPTRLDRPDVMTPLFGTDPYAREELVAEMTAAMLCGETGIAPQTLANSAAYIASWIARFKEDRKLLISAASHAQKAADFILGVDFAAGEDKVAANAS